jgi:hypothetical protein
MEAHRSMKAILPPRQSQLCEKIDCTLGLVRISCWAEGKWSPHDSQLAWGEHAIADQAFALTADDSEHFTDDLDLLLLH